MGKAIYHTLTRGFNATWISLLQVLVGSMFLALTAQIAVPLPFTPVPVSLQSFGVALLAITLGSRKAPLAVLAYLTQASMGLPVLAAGSVNPAWMFGPRAGFLIGFVVASYVVGRLLESRKSNHFIANWMILSLNEVIILAVGSLWLGYFVGWENSIAMGFIPFIPGGLLKITVAASSIKPLKWFKR